MSLEEKLRCFFCHATNAIKGRKLTLDVLTPGVQCEHCHGPAEKHVQSVTKGESPPVSMKDLSKLSTEEVANSAHNVIAPGKTFWP